MSKSDIRPEFECQNKILNVKMQYSAPDRMSKLDFEWQNAVFGPNSNDKLDINGRNAIFGRNSKVKMEFRMSTFGSWRKFECQNRTSKSKCDIQSEFEC